MKVLKEKITKKELAILIPGLISIIVTSLIFKTKIISIITSICGVLYTFLIGKKLRLGYLFGIINVTLYGIILYIDRLYGGAIYNLFYGLPILIYGYYYWSTKKKDDSVNNLSKKGKRVLMCVFLLTLILTIYLGLVKQDFLLSFDVLTTSLGFIGMFLLSNKYVEQWPIWIMCNLANVCLWTYLTFRELSNIPVAIMWFSYLINSLYGYYNWNKKLS